MVSAWLAGDASSGTGCTPTESSFEPARDARNSAANASGGGASGRRTPLATRPIRAIPRHCPQSASVSACQMSQPTTVVFDLGGVLIDWDPRYLYRQLFDDPDEMESFLGEVTTAEWNAHQDAGRPWAEAIELLVAEHPERRELIEAFHRRWREMLAGEIPGTVDLLAELRARASDCLRSATGQRRCSRLPENGSTSSTGSK